jgi:hypothetical protein
MIIEKTTIDERYIEAVQQLAAVRIQLRMAMKLLMQSRPMTTDDSAEIWKMQLAGLQEEVLK